jgi:hypothetical protein
VTGVLAGRRLAILVTWMKRLFIGLAIGFLLYFGWHSRALLINIVASATLPGLAAAVAFWLLMHLLSPLFATIVFRGSGFPLGYGKALNIHLVNLPARYIPGGVWHTFGRVVAFRNLGIDAGRISLFVVLENVVAAAVAFLLGGGLLFVYRGADHWGSIALLCAVVSGLLLLILPLLLRMRISGRRMGATTVKHYLGSIAVVALIWCVTSAAFVAFVASFEALPLQSRLPETAAAYLFSWGVGYIAIFAPQGVGVFELMAGELLRGSLPLGGVAVLLAGFRVVIFVADLLAWLAGRLIALRNRG